MAHLRTLLPSKSNQSLIRHLHSSTAKSCLRHPNLLQSSSFINGLFITSTATPKPLHVCNPFNAEPIHTVHEASTFHTIAAFIDAKSAFHSWAVHTSLSARIAIIQRLQSELEANRNDLATLITLENGKPFSQSLAEVSYAISFFPWASQPSLHRLGTYIDSDTPNSLHYATRVAAGVVLAITPWNFPLALLCRKVAPALIAGCTMVVKPSELTPLTALAFAELARRAGVPPGVFNTIVSSDGAGTLRAGLHAQRVDMVSFTGSTRVGRLVGSAAMAAGCSNLSLELGGNAPFIVCDDADLELAVESAVQNKVRCSGQACVSANRFLVQDGVYESFANALSKRVSTLKTGDGMEKRTELGPMITAQAAGRVNKLIETDVAKGAKLRVGHGVPKGTMMGATVVCDVTDGMSLAREEVFGPVWSVQRFTSVDECIDRANLFGSGLAAYMFSRDAGRIQRICNGLRYGMVAVNGGNVSDAATPFGGMNDSGCGREGGMQAVSAYTQLKYIRQEMHGR